MADQILYGKDDAGNEYAFIDNKWVPAQKDNMFGDVGQTLTRYGQALGTFGLPLQAAGRMMTQAPEETMSVAQGATLGWADEGLAAQQAAIDVAQGNAPSYQEAYNKRYQDIQNRMKIARAESPIKSTALELAGGLLTGGVGAGRIAALTGGERLLALGGAGTAYGGLAGAGYAEPGERMKGAATGMLMGGMLGVGVPLVAQGARAVAGKVSDRFGGMLGGQEQVAGRMARKEIQKALERGQMTPEQASGYIRTLGREGTLADIPAMQPLTRGITAVPGKAQQVGLKMSAERAAERNQRVIQNITKSLGADDFYSTIDDITARQKELSSPLYQKAMSATANIDDVVKYTDDILAKSKGKIGSQVRKVSSMLSRDGVPETNMEVLHGIKMEIDDMISTAQRQGQNNAVRQLSMIKNKLLNKMDKIEIDGERVYQKARAIFADEAANKNALDMGLKFLREDAAITSKMIRGMSESEQEMFRLGVAKALKDKVLGSPEGADAWKRIMGNQSIRNKIRAAFPSSKTYKEFEKMMKREAVFARTRQAISGGSPTARIEAEKVDIGELTAVARGDTVGAVIGAIKRLFNKVTGPSEAVRNELADILFKKGYFSDQQKLQELINGVTKLPSKQKDFMSQLIARAVTRQLVSSQQ